MSAAQHNNTMNENSAARKDRDHRAGHSAFMWA
jgi:hypothetical protein